MTLSGSIDRGLRFLLCGQTDAGFWSDWRLPPGESRSWTTAYVAYRLCSMPVARRTEVEEAMVRADAWLRATELPGGGWGYSEETGPDADSTSLAVLVLGVRGSPALDAAHRRIREHQRADGGFSTFTAGRAFGSWVESHPDVSATALLALLSTPFESSGGIADGLRYVHDCRRPDGLWNSFWWTSCLYATEAGLALLQAANEDLRERPTIQSLHTLRASTSFELGLLLMCLVRLGASGGALADHCTRMLMSLQLPDGSWPSAAVLRLTHRHVSQPWIADDASPRFGDERRLFTTATVVSALAALEGAVPAHRTDG